MIAFQEVSKGYGARLLLDEISFKINNREKVGVIGRNGHGKTTLFRMILGQESPDSGQIHIPKNYRIQTVEQVFRFSQQETVQEAALGLPDSDKDQIWQAERILSGLGFSDDDMSKDPKQLSGGYQVRLNLTKALLAQPDMLLLDEPNNYLDITSIRWLTNFLKDWASELMLITHDRMFMDRIINHSMIIHRKKIRKIPGDTAKLYEQIATEEEVYEKTRINDEKKKKEMELFISRFRAKARLAGMVQSRIKTLEKMGGKDKLEKIKNLDFSFTYKPFSAKYLVQAENLSFAYPNQHNLFENLSFSIGAKERICVIGPNGQGKTTLLKILAGILQPVHGQLSNHPATDFGYYEQTNAQSLQPHLTAADEIQQSNVKLDVQKVRSICGAMMFEGDDALKKISVLSGGEKCRVALGKILAKPVNLLLLDEPTNHLDMPSCDSLIEALRDFPGAVVMVTHNEMLLHEIAEKLIVFQHGKGDVFAGNYQDFLSRGGWDKKESTLKDNVVNTVVHNDTENKTITNSGNVLSKKQLRKKKSEIHSERSRELKPVKDQSQRIEKEIMDMEKDAQTMQNQLISANTKGDGPAIAKLSQQLTAVNKQIEQHYNQLEQLAALETEKEKKYIKMLAELEQ